mmetsp:Transcript_25296/g.63348  ORF Transcript_25296/g.63348 Transcript_25296/m.63348 type:complete len:124 (-) Transcript_25296:512-883(-)
MSGHTASMNARSCDTSSTVVLSMDCSRVSSHSTPSTDKWLVGSSNTSRSGSSISAAASATRLRCPPLSSPILRSINSVQPNLSSAAAALDSVSHPCSASMASSASAMSRSFTSPRAAAAMVAS